MVFGCKRTTEDLTVVHNIDVEDVVSEDKEITTESSEENDIQRNTNWNIMDAATADIKITEYDSLGRPTRVIDAHLNRNTKKELNDNVIDKSKNKLDTKLTDKSSSITKKKEENKVHQVVKTKLPWWQTRCFRIVMICLAAVIAALIAIRSRSKWWNYIRSLILHHKS